MTEPTPVHGCTIDGQPAMPILISEYNTLVARATEAEAKVLDYENRITWHTTCESCARILDSSIRETERADRAEAANDRVSAECNRIEAAVRGNPTGPDFDGAYLAAIGHIRTALDEPGPAATQATDGICSDPAPETEPNNPATCICTEDAWPPHCPCRADEYPPGPA